MASRTAGKARTEILEMLKEDHKRAKKAFSDFEKLDMEDEEDAAEAQALVAQTCAELEVHATIEEELFYPAIREVIKQTELIDEAEVEHGTLKSLIEQLKASEQIDEKFAAQFKVLGEYVKHHVREEENEMFELLSRSKVDWEGLQQEMQTRREELEQELGLTEEEEEEEVETVQPVAEAKEAGRSKRGRGKQVTEEQEVETETQD